MNYRYCFRCAHKLVKKEEYFECPGCGFHLYQNATPCNGVIIQNKSGDVLLVKRANDPKKNTWDLAGGFTTIRETMEESVHRELKEELHIDIDISRLHYLASFHDKYLFMGEEYETLGFVYTLVIEDENFLPDDDISGFQFFKKSEIPWDTIAFPSVKKALRKFMNI